MFSEGEEFQDFTNVHIIASEYYMSNSLYLRSVQSYQRLHLISNF